MDTENYDWAGHFSARTELESSGCVVWLRAKDTDGYGVTWDPVRKKQVKAHRLAYECFCGPIPPKHFVCHSCDNPSCCNPLHLFVGTAADNSLDRNKKGRVSAGERHGAIMRRVTARGERSIFSKTHPRYAEIRAKSEAAHVALKGEANGRSVLTAEAVIEIKKLLALKIHGAKIARKFGVAPTTISRIKRGRGWLDPIQE